MPEKQEEYSRKYDMKVKGGSVFKQIDRERSLVHLMRVNLLKRMESSIHSFGMTVAALLTKIDDLLIKLDNIQQYSNADININEIDIDDDDVENMLIGSKVKVLLQDIDHIKWKQDLQDDREKLEKLLIESAKVQAPRDAKLNKLKSMIDEKLLQPINGENKKIIILLLLQTQQVICIKSYHYGCRKTWDKHSTCNRFWRQSDYTKRSPERFKLHFDKFFTSIQREAKSIPTYRVKSIY